ncbi:hypothetical protein GCM10022215_23180 [Nocardioides fonticola]|uniref:Uncharacterized protein n=1 Tax=Nocardioides fonticola TaxID=450363 RepID=A0ABP7XJA1_9ACTN
MPRSAAPSTRATGLGPERTARGAGRLAEELLPFAGARLGAGRLPRAVLRALVVELPVLRARVLDPPRAEVLLDVLREPGGEDVRVAMSPT